MAVCLAKAYSGLTQESTAGPAFNTNFHRPAQGNGYQNGYTSYYSSTYSTKKPSEAVKPEPEPMQPIGEAPNSSVTPASSLEGQEEADPQYVPTFYFP